MGMFYSVICIVCLYSIGVIVYSIGYVFNLVILFVLLLFDRVFVFLCCSILYSRCNDSLYVYVYVHYYSKRYYR